MNGSVCIDPWPDHDPSVRQTTTGVRGRGPLPLHDAPSRPAPNRADIHNRLPEPAMIRFVPGWRVLNNDNPQATRLLSVGTVLALYPSLRR
jgi:hypothetical protein